MHKCYHQTSQFLFDSSGLRIKLTLQPHVSETMQKEGNIYTMEGPKSILIFWESSDFKWKGGRAGRGKLERDRYVLYHRSVTLSAATSRVTQCDVIT